MLILDGRGNSGQFVWSVYDDGIEYRADVSSHNYSENAWYPLTCAFDLTKETKVYVNSELRSMGEKAMELV